MNIQITRIFRIVDPTISVIIVTPFSLSAEISEYYYKMLQMNGIP